MRPLAVVTILSLLLPVTAFAHEFIQVEGMLLGYYPELADGVRIVTKSNSREMQFSPGAKCVQNVQTERSGLAYSGMSFEQGNRADIRAKLTGIIGYPGLRGTSNEDWLASARGLAADFYRANLASTPPATSTQLLFMPVVLSPKPIQVVKTEWTREAREILAKNGWKALEQYCGTHFVEAIGEENFIVYAVRISYPSSESRTRIETVRLDLHNQSPGLLLANLSRMRQRFEFNYPDSTVSLDILQVGGRDEEVRALNSELANFNAKTELQNAAGSTVTRTQLECSPDRLEPCQKLAQLFLDFQFKRLTFRGENPSFTPVRFRIAPIQYLRNLNE